MPAQSLMVLGTSSGVGKSVIAAGFCRLFSDWGYRTAPFKAQNMSNNSCVTEEGGEIGRAQAVQAECARVTPSVHMNPILLKPSSDDGSQVILQGKAVGHFKAREYYAEGRRLEKVVRESYEVLSREYEVLVLEGAGSPVEMNLKARDLVNMRMAEWAGARCVLVADIDRGGVFASVIGTIDLLEPAERARMAGIIINKFRGDISLFQEGVDFLEKRTGLPVLGTLPFDRELFIEEEDSLTSFSGNLSPEALDIAVVLLPRMSNFTDFEVFKHEPSVHLRYIKKNTELGSPDLLILPGTKSTIQDFLYLKESGMVQGILNYARQGRILGICGGYQMMGSEIRDPQHYESERTEIQGLGLFEMTTEFNPEKILKKSQSPLEVKLFGEKVTGEIAVYEIHMGRSAHHFSCERFGTDGAIHANGRWLGTYSHGLFDAGSFRKSFLEALAKSAGKKMPVPAGEDFSTIKERHYNWLKNLLQTNLDLDEISRILRLFPKTASPC